MFYHKRRVYKIFGFYFFFSSKKPQILPQKKRKTNLTTQTVKF